MATAMTFTSLISDMTAYLERGDAVTDRLPMAQYPSLVNMAERHMAHDLKIEGFVHPVTTALVSGTSVYAKPTGWIKTVSMNIGTGTNSNSRTPVLPRGYEYLRNYFRDDTVTGQPRFYADYDFDHWIVGPTPDAAYPMEVVYYMQPPLLDDANQTNWLTENAPMALLYRALAEASIFIKRDDRLQTWMGLYTQAIQALSTEDMQRAVDRSATRQGA